MSSKERKEYRYHRKLLESKSCPKIKVDIFDDDVNQFDVIQDIYVKLENIEELPDHLIGKCLKDMTKEEKREYNRIKSKQSRARQSQEKKEM